MGFFKNSIKLFIVLALIFIGFLGYAYFIEPNSLVIKNQSIKLDCLKSDLPDKFVQISDLHFTDKTKEARIDQISEAIKSQDPAAVFVTGDLITNDTGIGKAVGLIAKISANYKTFVIFGNWDYWALDYKVGDFKTQLEGVGAKVLVNDAVEINSGSEKLDILGVKDPYTSGELKGDLEKAEKKIVNGDKSCRLLLAHSPNIITEAVEKKTDLVLVGHTHGGQVYIPFLTKYAVPARGLSGEGYVKGLYEVDKTQMYVNEGIGISALPLRFLVPPEITVFTLRKGSPSQIILQQ